MSGASNEPVRLRPLVLLFWVLFLSFLVYLLVAGLLMYQRGGTVRVTFIFGEPLGDVIAAILVILCLTLDFGLSWRFYRRALQARAEASHIYALASVVAGVCGPYLYGLLLSFIGIMRDVFPILYLAFFYIGGVAVGLQIIPRLVAHIESD
jgi:hypothetical protein